MLRPTRIRDLKMLHSNRIMEVQNDSKTGVMCMKSIFCLLLLFFTYFLYGQENSVKKPEHIVIANDEIITMEKALEYEKGKYIKAVRNGVSDEERDRLFKLFGDKIPPKEFIFYIELYTEEEKLEREKVEHEYVVEDIDTQYDNKQVISVNDSIRDFTVKMIDGTNIKLSDLKGKVVLINFWATWCAPCIREFYEFQEKIVEPFKNSMFVLLPISRGETEGKVKNKMAQLKKGGIDFNVGIDPHQTIAGLYNAKSAIPKNILIDKTGIIRYISIGYNQDNLDNIPSMIEKMLDE